MNQVTQNVSGVYTFATYGGIRESMSIRGLRGIPTLKNGILISKDIGGRGFATDMQGVESVQVIKGADAVNMGASTSYGNAGGLINLVTKTPHFINRGKVSTRVGTFNQVRPTFDIETTLERNKNAAIRLNGAYESTQTYQKISDIGGESFYINPSLAFRPDDKTDIILELDHYSNTRNFDPGTVNQSIDKSENLLFSLPRDKFLGFTTDKTVQKLTTAGARIKRYLSPDYYIRGAIMYSNYDTSGPSTKLNPLDSDPEQSINIDRNTIFSRTLERHKEHSDQNYVAQVDFVGDHIKTGVLTHTFQAGIDYRSYQVTQRKFNSIATDTIDITKPVENHISSLTDLPDFELKENIVSKSNSFGFSAQEFLEIQDWAKIKAGLRIGTITSYTPNSNQVTHSSFVNPFIGLMLNVYKDINIFGNYTNTTDPSTAEFPDENGNPLGNETFNQFEVGVRSSWFDKRFRADVVYYRIDNDEMNVQQTQEDENGISQTLGYYFKGGHVRYQGLEVDLIGQLTHNLSLQAGFAKMEGKYISSNEFEIGSSPKNIPDYTAHAHINYSFDQTAIKGASIGIGYYYIGKRPYNDWIQGNIEYHGITPGLKPWILKSYSQINAQLSYDLKYLNNPTWRNFDIRLIVNNIGNQIGYTAYRDKNINRIDPINAALIVGYKF